MITSLKVYFIKSLDDSYLKRSLESFHNTVPSRSDFEIIIVEEKNQREETLNYILSINEGTDFLVVADDIVFINGWFESLCKNFNKGDIIGFSTFFPDSKIIQNYGYDFIEIDGKLTYQGLFKNENFNDVILNGPRICDSVTGCLMYIKSGVLTKVNEFPLDGNNRVGEMIFSQMARKYGFETLVLDSFVFHEGISSKQNKNIKLSSLSWLYEKEKWEENVIKYFNEVKPKKSYRQLISSTLKRKLLNSNKTLIYGCGTVAHFIVTSNLLSNFDLCSGLPEEINKNFLDKKIKNVKILNFNQYDLIIISSIGYESQIISSYFNNINDKLHILTKQFKNNIIKYK